MNFKMKPIFVDCQKGHGWFIYYYFFYFLRFLCKLRLFVCFSYLDKYLSCILLVNTPLIAVT